MGWHDEQERLRAETLAFVRRLAEDAAEIEPPSLWRRSEGILQDDMQALLEDFRNRQRLAQIEREAGYYQAMQRIRAVTEQHV